LKTTRARGTSKNTTAAKLAHSLAPSLAKIARPRLTGVYQRQRVFALLDAVADRRVIWLSAPAGYGKTIAVASWLQARATTAIWYLCDDGDGDIASFFHFLSLTLANSVRAQATPLPLLSPELYSALPTFVRNYFREYCARLPVPALIVLDNWHDIPANAALRELLPIAINELPAGVGLIVICREEPAANLSRLQSSNQMAMIGWHDLKLTEQETADIAARYEPASGQRTVLPADELYAVTQGWAAGLTVMLRHERSQALTHLSASQRATQGVFDYLTCEVFDRLQEPIKDFLLKTACLEHIAVPVAQQLTGNPDAREILDRLVRGNAFTLQRPATATYYYHPLFRQLLRDRATARFSVAEQRGLLTAAARCLIENQGSETAVTLLLEAGSWQEATNLLLQLAPLLVQQGRFKTLADWIEAIPASLRTNCAWLSFWHGTAQFAIALAEARPTLEHAYALFVTDDDPLGQMLSASAILQHHGYSYMDFNPMVPWIAVLEALLGNEPRFPSLSVELQILSGFLNAAAQVHPTISRLTGCVARMNQLVRTDVDPPSQATAIAALLHFYGMCGKTAEFRELAPRIAALMERPEFGPAARITIYWIHAYHLHYCGDSIQAQSLLDEALTLAQHHKLAAFELRVRLSRMQSTDDPAHLDALPAALAVLEPALAAAPPMVHAHSQYLRALHELARGDLSLAQQYADQANGVFRSANWIIALAMTLLLLAEIKCEKGLYGEATALLSDCRRCIEGLDIPFFEFNQQLVAAEIARRSGSHQEFIDALRRAFSLGRQHGYANLFYVRARLLPRLLPYALQHDIEVEYCRWLVRKRGLHPPIHDVAHWPWPIRIRTLGQFQVFLDEKLLEHSGKSQQRPLDLLKGILVGNNGVDVGRLMGWLWPDIDGDSARNAFDLALHRLRKLLQGHDAVILAQGRLRLDPRQVWVDAHALDKIARGDDPLDDHTLSVQRLLDLYRGPFLVDEEHPWTFATRERLRSQFIRLVIEWGSSLQAQHHWDSAAELYQRTLEIEPLAEDIHRAMIRCLIAQGRDAEALAAFQRCKEVLARLLGATPSPLTHAIFDR